MNRNNISYLWLHPWLEIDNFGLFFLSLKEILQFFIMKACHYCWQEALYSLKYYQNSFTVNSSFLNPVNLSSFKLTNTILSKLLGLHSTHSKHSCELLIILLFSLSKFMPWFYCIFMLLMIAFAFKYKFSASNSKPRTRSQKRANNSSNSAFC